MNVIQLLSKKKIQVQLHPLPCTSQFYEMLEGQSSRAAGPKVAQRVPQRVPQTLFAQTDMRENIVPGEEGEAKALDSHFVNALLPCPWGSDPRGG